MIGPIPATGDDQLPFDPPLAPGSDGTGGEASRAGDVIDGVALSTFGVGGRARLVYVSENLAALLGHDVGDVLGRDPGALLHAATPIEQLEAVAAIVDTGAQAVVRLSLAHADGGPVPVEATLLTVPGGSGEPVLLSMFRRIGAGAGIDQVLAEQARVLELVARGGDLAALLAHIVRPAERLAGPGRVWFSLVDRFGQLQPILHGELSPQVVASCLDAAWSPPSSGSIRRVDVEELPEGPRAVLRRRGMQGLWLVPATTPDGRPCGLLALGRPNTLPPRSDERRALTQVSQLAAFAVDRSHSDATLAREALYDRLTQLPGRTLIMDRLDQAVARLERDRSSLVVLVVDVNRLKRINDTWGFAVGDEVLVEVARRLRRSVRLGDTVGRLGGDRFVAVCVAVDDDRDMARMAERVLAAIAEPIEAGHRSLRVTASVGLVRLDRPGQSALAVISNAETALHRAEAAGSGQWAAFEEGLQQRIVGRYEVEQALHVAISADELRLHYQPVIDVRTGRMAGAEALLRWERPGHGLLPPAAFIDIAEESGLILALGAWAIDTACRDLASWPRDDTGRRPLITVNLSARELTEADLVPGVVSAIERHGVDPSDLGFEVTESVRVEDLETASRSMRALSALGCALAIDDFGIGYATLDHLRRFSMADALKIDRSFVAGLGASREDTAIVTASVALAKSLGLVVIAEGVERPQHLAELRALEVDFAQGFAISHPVPVSQARRLWGRGVLVDAPAAPAQGRAPSGQPGTPSSSGTPKVLRKPETNR